ncbi:MAG: folylpolyglutamate synthase/dihydrofolate synthase family protein, partial [Chitinophagaceae bacterium]
PIFIFTFICMTYDETLDYLYEKLPMFSRTGAAAIKQGMGNIERLSEFLGNPHQKFSSIHIAGTNGKGSTSHMLAAVFQVAGHRTGLYTSPHLQDFRERIRIDGEMISKDFIIGFVEKIQPLIEELEPSFFEITVAMAFDYFASKNVTMAIVEVGLGGRLDSTNIITPEVSVITNISWDHMNLLGDTLEKIAFEKAGIIKAGVPVVMGEKNPVTAPVFVAAAQAVNTTLSFASDHHRMTDFKFARHNLVAEITRLHTDEKTSYTLDLPGIYQGRNLVTVLEVLKTISQVWLIEDNHIHKALSEVKKLTGLFGRWELIHEHPEIFLDVAHNEAGMKAIKEQLEISNYHNLHVIIGMVKDKEIEKVLELLPDSATYYFTNAAIPRALPALELSEKASKYKLRGHIYTNVNIALKSAVEESEKNDLILVCGSVFVVGEVDRNMNFAEHGRI